MARLKALCVVAHPDDCIIFARPFIFWSTQFNWTILYLTYSDPDPRAIEISQYWDKRNVKVKFLGNVDDYKDMSSGFCSFNTVAAKTAIIQEAENYDLILTHNETGEYGHLHHRFVHSCLLNVDKPKAYFSDWKNGNYNCSVEDIIDLKEIPLHGKVVSQFPNINVRYYFLTDSAKELLHGNP